jgi:hypothetical protein
MATAPGKEISFKLSHAGGITIAEELQQLVHQADVISG